VITAAATLPDWTREENVRADVLNKTSERVRWRRTAQLQGSICLRIGGAGDPRSIGRTVELSKSNSHGCSKKRIVSIFQVIRVSRPYDAAALAYFLRRAAKVDLKCRY
jgi:hypothetical protein